MLTISGSARFVSDLHLRAERPDLTQRFFAFLADTTLRSMSALFILGDLFEYWIGDDSLVDPFNRSICEQLKRCSAAGTAVYFIGGNRDFLIGDDFAEATGIQLLEDITRVGTGDTVTLLMHGDTICTDDHPYQDFRRLVRSESWQKSFLGRPLSERLAEVEKLRQRSAVAMQSKSASIMDANPVAIRKALIDNQCTRLIHGHTHRPSYEEIELPGGVAERWVLSDWTTDRGDALEMTSTGVHRIDLGRA